MMIELQKETVEGHELIWRVYAPNETPHNPSDKHMIVGAIDINGKTFYAPGYLEPERARDDEVIETYMDALRRSLVRRVEQEALGITEDESEPQFGSTDVMIEFINDLLELNCLCIDAQTQKVRRR